MTRARRLRADGDGRRHWLRTVMMPVFVDALDRSIALAASMDSRGYGRRGTRSAAVRRATAALLLAALVLLCVAAYALFDPSAFGGRGPLLLVVALAAAAAAVALAGRRTVHTRYRPDAWHLAETLVAGSGLLVAAGVLALGRLHPVAAFPPISPLDWPTAPTLALVSCLVAALPVVLAPPVPAPVGVAAVATAVDRPDALALRVVDA